MSSGSCGRSAPSVIPEHIAQHIDDGHAVAKGRRPVARQVVGPEGAEPLVGGLRAGWLLAVAALSNAGVGSAVISLEQDDRRDIGVPQQGGHQAPAPSGRDIRPART